MEGGDTLANGKAETADEDGEEEVEEVLVPDGGWGWVVCFGSFIINFILDGTLFSFGILMLALIDDFGEDESTTSWIGSAQMGLHMIMGPVISALLQKFSIRQVVVTGSFLSSLAFIVSVFAPNVYVLIFTYGVLGGICFGMVFLPSIIILVPYFSKSRAIATGIATSGSGMGTFAFAYITDLLLQHYNWRGTLLILGGILLHCMLCGLLFRPIEARNTTKKRRASDYKLTENGEREFLIGDTEKLKNGNCPLIESSKALKINGHGNQSYNSLVDEGTNNLQTHNVFEVSKDRNSVISDPDHKELSTNTDVRETLHTPSVTEPDLDLKANELSTNNSALGSNSPSVTSGGIGDDQMSAKYCYGTSCNNIAVNPANHGFIHQQQPSACRAMEIPVILQTPPSPALKAASALSRNDGTSVSARDSKDNRSERGGDFCPDVQVAECSTSSVIPSNHSISQKCESFEHSREHETGDEDTSLAPVILVDTSLSMCGKLNNQPESKDSNFQNGNAETVDCNSNSEDKGWNMSEPQDGALSPTSPTSPNPQNQHMCISPEGSQGKFSVNRLYQSADHIHNIARGLQDDSYAAAGEHYYNHNDHSNHVHRRRGNGNKDRHHPNRNSHGHQYNGITSLQPIPGSPTALSKNQAVSLFGINGYLNLHPHHRSSPHGSNTYRHYHSRKHHNHSHHHLGGSKSDVAMHINKGLLNPILRKDIYYSGSIQHLSAYQQHGSMTSFLAAMTRCSSSEENLDTISSDVHGKGGSPCEPFFNRCFPLRLLRDKVFLLLLVTFTMWTAQSVTMTYLPGYAVSLGIDRSQAAWLISIIGVANVLGRLVSGFITDCLPIPSIWLYVVALSLAAAINFIIPSLTSFVFLAIAAVLFGLCMAVAVSMRTIVLADQMGLEVLTESFGIVAFLQGVAFIIVPPIAGKMMMTMESSRPAFWLASGMYTLSTTATIWAALLNRKRSTPLPGDKDPVDV